MAVTCKVLRIGVFFDGTGNNLYNDEAGRSENGVSNIAKLYRLYPKEMFRSDKINECIIYTQPIYIEGVGTTKGKSDDLKGGATGAGGAKRIRTAINQIRQLRELFPKTEYKCYIDVFGFSRGAALARDFINTMYRNEMKEKLEFTFKFVGLFDTVGSFGLAGNDINYKPLNDKYTEATTVYHEVRGITPSAENFERYNLNLTPTSAERIVHFVALDEYRANFPLSDTDGAGETYEFIGAHSDVGGGYPAKTVEKIFTYKFVNSIEEAKASVENPPNGIKIGEKWQYLDEKPEVAAVLNGKRFIRCTGERTVYDDLQRVAFVAMYNLAAQSGVPFLPFSENVSAENIQQSQEQVAGTKYTPHPMRNFNDVDWIAEQQKYCQIATTSPTALNGFLKAQCVYNNEMGKPYRSELHLNILAKYAHNSAEEGLNTGLANFPPPIGFLHFLGSPQTRDFANYPRRVKANNQMPTREVYRNDVSKAIVLRNNSSR